MTNCPWGWPQLEQWRKRSQLWWKQGHGHAIMFDLTLLMWLGQSCSDRIKAQLSPMGPIRQMRTICAWFKLSICTKSLGPNREGAWDGGSCGSGGEGLH